MVHFIIILLLRKGVKVFFGLCAYFFISFLVIKEKPLLRILGKISMTIQPSRNFQFLPYHAKNIPRIREFLFRIYLH
jgi:hypothetical protein